MSAFLTSRCACGGLLVMPPDPDTWAERMRVHNGTQRHSDWREQERDVSFEVAVIERRVAAA